MTLNILRKPLIAVPVLAILFSPGCEEKKPARAKSLPPKEKKLYTEASYPIAKELTIDGKLEKVSIIGRTQTVLFIQKGDDPAVIDCHFDALSSADVRFTNQLPMIDSRTLVPVQKLKEKLAVLSTAPDGEFGPPPIRENTLAGLQIELQQAEKVVKLSRVGRNADEGRIADRRTVTRTYPFKRAITNADGAQMDCIILGRTDTHLVLQKFGKTRRYNFPIDKLVPEDRHYFRRLVLGSVTKIQEIQSEIAEIDKKIEALKRNLGRSLVTEREKPKIRSNIHVLQNKKAALQQQLFDGRRGGQSSER